MKRWKTVTEDQVNKAEQQIHNLLKKENPPASKKGVAFAMAIVGIALIAVGVLPIFSDSLDEGLIFGNIFTGEEDGESETIDFNPFAPSASEDGDGGFFEDSLLNTDPDSLKGALPIIGAPTTTNGIDFASEATEINIEADGMGGSGPEKAAAEEIPEPTIAETTPFKINTHTGKTDTSMPTGDQISIEEIPAQVSGESETYHSGAPGTTDSGPEVWALVLLSAIVAVGARKIRYKTA